MHKLFQLVDRYDMSALTAALIGAAIAAVVGAIVALPVLKLGGVWLAIATLAFAFFFDAVIVNDDIAFPRGALRNIARDASAR